MIEKERVEFGLFSTQMSRDWHMGHAVRAFSNPGSDPRAPMFLVFISNCSPVLVTASSGFRARYLYSLGPVTVVLRYGPAA